MDFTFGIVTDGQYDSFVDSIVASIRAQCIPNYEIIIVGNTTISGEKIINIPFDESIKPMWISKKKNIVYEHAKYENIVLLHDYIVLCDGWYSGFLQYGSNYEVCVTKILNTNNTRFRDYTLFPHTINNVTLTKCLLPYDFEQNSNINRFTYISGSYMIIKKHIALQYLWNDTLCWGQGEDCELCRRFIQNNILMKCNQYSTVQFLKDKSPAPWEQEISYDELKELENVGFF